MSVRTGFNTLVSTNISTDPCPLARQALFIRGDLLYTQGVDFFDWIFPKKCVGCGVGGTYFCPKCASGIKQKDLFCPICERPSIGGTAHPLCRKRYGLDGIWSLGAYQDPLRSAIKKLKYRFVRDLAVVLADLLIEYWARNPAWFLDELKKDRGLGWLIVPVPLYKSRQNWRGFNQSELLGQLLAKKIGLGYADVLIRLRGTDSQVKLMGKERRANVFNAFALSPNSPRLTQNVLLFDDVWTTGSTLKECCYVLKRGGAKRVWAITLAC